jgi:UDP-glucose 4-epimerase
VEALVANGHAVRVLDNLATGTLANLSRVMGAIELHVGDLADLDFVRGVSRGVELVFHQAAPTQWPYGLGDLVTARYAGAMGTVHVLSAAREANVRRVIYASSFRVYGHPSCLPVDEEDATVSLDPYGAAKLAGEQACTICTCVYGLETVRLRYFNVFGPRQPAGSPYAALVSQALEAMLAGAAPLVDRDDLGGQDLIYVGDAVHATLLAAEAPRVAGKVYNIGRGRPTAAREVVAALNSILGTQIEPVYTPSRGKDDFDNVANTARAEVELGFCAGTDLEQGLRRCVEERGQELSRRCTWGDS